MKLEEFELGKKGGKKHLKRRPAPKSWPIHRKEFLWAPKPMPGPHPISDCIPLTLIVRDILGFAKTWKEAKIIISQGKLKVDGKIQREERFPGGLMDVIYIPEIQKVYRILPSEKGLMLHPIEAGKADFKLCRIENKTIVKGGHVQLNLHDGTNILLRTKESQNLEGNAYETLGTLKISIPKREILEYIKLAKGAYALITYGKNAGRHGKIVAIEKKPGQSRKDLLVTVEDKNGVQFQTILDYIFAVGSTKPETSLPEVE